MAEARPSVNHVTIISSSGNANSLPHDPVCGNEQDRRHVLEQSHVNNSELGAKTRKSVEMDTESDFKLPPDVMHINGFYTIADTLHKENANSAVTLTTQSQMGEVRMSSRVAEPTNYLNHGHANMHDWAKNISPFANDLQVRAPKQMIENGALHSDLGEITNCVEQISLLEDNGCISNTDGCKHGRPLPEIGTELLDANFKDDPLTCDDESSMQPVEPSVRKKEKSVVSTEKIAHAADTKNLNHDVVPSSISEFVLGHEKGPLNLALHVPPDDADLDTILPNGFDAAIELVRYQSELQMPDIMRLITKDLSEPYSIYTYRYFIHNWPKLCFLAMHGSLCVGAIVCKLDVHKKVVHRGYIAMLAVDEKYRKHKIGSSLVRKAIRAMIRSQCDEVVLETEITNKPALQLYENLGFSRDKRLFRYYLNGVDALRLKLWLR